LGSAGKHPGPHGGGEEPKPMTNGPKKSDLAEVAGKPTNKAGVQTAAEPVEPRARAEGNVSQQSTYRTQCRDRVSQALERVRQAARARRKEQFTALLHHISIDLLRLSFYALKRSAAPGVDGVTWKDYEAALEGNLRGLHERVHRGAYRALPSRRKYIPKPDWRQRPLGIAALEDKILQRAVVGVLNAIYEEDFLGFSYGFRPGRSQHQALDALCTGLLTRKVNWVLDLDIKGFFDTVSHSWLLRFLEHRIGDERILRLIRKWLKAGVFEEGIVTESEAGTPQGATVTPLTQKVILAVWGLGSPALRRN
jgi:RNA-directed DNA polymerase